MLEMHLTCPNCEKTFVVYDWQLWRDSEENESFQCPCCHTAPDEEACYRLKDGFLEPLDAVVYTAGALDARAGLQAVFP